MNANSMKKVKGAPVTGGIKGTKTTKYHGAVTKHGSKKGGKKGY